MGKKFTKLWLLTQNRNRNYDTYDSCVVIADTEEEARLIEPSAWSNRSSWVDPEYVNVEYIGKTDQVFEKSVICASFNAG